MGVPNTAETSDYYAEFGLTPDGDDWFRTRDGGRQLRVVYAPSRRLSELNVGVDDRDGIDRVASNLARLGISFEHTATSVSALESTTGTRATLEIVPRIQQNPVPPTAYNGPGRTERVGRRAAGLLRTERVMPRKLGHAVLGTTDLEATQAFFGEGLGFKLSDVIKDNGAFLRCSPTITICLSLRLRSRSCITPRGRSTTSMTWVGVPPRCWRTIRTDMSGVWVDTLPARISSGTSRIRPATSASTTQTWIASRTTSSGHRKSSKEPKDSSTGAPPPPPSFLAPEDLSALMTGSHSAP